MNVYGICNIRTTCNACSVFAYQAWTSVVFLLYSGIAKPLSSVKTNWTPRPFCICMITNIINMVTMWLRKIQKGYNKCESGTYRLNFLWNEGNIYIMDNHLAAAFCWLQSCDKDCDYNFLHIDRHNDFICNATLDKYQIVTEAKSIDKYCSLKNDTEQLYRWDNYIKSTQMLFPHWFNRNVFSTQESPVSRIDQCLIPQMCIDYIDPLEINDNLNELFTESYHLPYSKFKWIVNIDLDFFFDEDRNRLFDDEMIMNMANQINKNLRNIEVLTICLSPECCGQNSLEGWKRSIEALDIFCSKIDSLKGRKFPNDYK